MRITTSSTPIIFLCSLYIYNSELKVTAALFAIDPLVLAVAVTVMSNITDPESVVEKVAALDVATPPF
jgi:hypothetical protein